MKKKFLSLILGICFVFTSVFSFTSCSLIKSDDTKKNNEVYIKIGDTSITRGDLISAFYTYYQNNGSYFSYYDEDTIEESFYQWAIVREMLNNRSQKALNNTSSNLETIYYTKEDAETVWDSVKSYIYNQVSSYEKTIYSSKGYKEENYPSWIKSEDDEEDESKFTPYTRSEVTLNTKNVSEDDIATKLENISDEMISKVKEYLFEYASGTNEDGNEIRKSIVEDEKNYIENARNEAYTKYIASLVSSAKANGTSTDEEVCFKNEVNRIYEAYYNSKVTSNYQNYFLNEYLTNQVPEGKEGDEVALSDKLLVKAFLEEYYTEKQAFSSEADYIEKITDSDGAPLILYSYDGENYFFSVQHILIKFTDELTEEVKNLDGYSTNDLDAHYSDAYRTARNNLADGNRKAMLSEVKIDEDLVSITPAGNYYYYDETKKSEYGDLGENKEFGVYNGYVKLKELETEAEDGTKYIDFEGNKYKAEDVKFMANVDDVYEAFDNNFKVWKGLVEKCINGTLTKDELAAHEDMTYVFDTVKNMKSSGYTTAQIEEKVASYLFLELEWFYSADGLKNELSNKVGYIISNFDDENGSWVADFANGSRKLARDLEDGKVIVGETQISIEDIIKSGDVSNLTYTVVSDYGYHIIKVENVYKTNTSVSNLDKILTEDLKGREISSEDEVTVAKLIEFMKSNYVANSSNETLYDYFYEMLYKQYVGDSDSNGSYFIDLEYRWLNKLNESGQLQIIKKLTYTELMASIQK